MQKHRYTGLSPKTPIEVIEIGERKFRTWKRGEEPPMRKFVASLGANDRFAPEEWVFLLKRTYHLENQAVVLMGKCQTREDVEGRPLTTIFLGLRPQAIKAFREDSMSVFVGARKYTLREYEEGERERAQETGGDKQGVTEQGGDEEGATEKGAEEGEETEKGAEEEGATGNGAEGAGATGKGGDKEGADVDEMDLGEETPLRIRQEQGEDEEDMDVTPVQEGAERGETPFEIEFRDELAELEGKGMEGERERGGEDEGSSEEESSEGESSEDEGSGKKRTRAEEGTRRTGEEGGGKEGSKEEEQGSGRRERRARSR